MKKLVSLLLCLAILTSTSIASAEIVSSGLIMHLRADSGVTVDGSGNVTGWADMTANGNNAASSLGAVKSFADGFGPQNRAYLKFTSDDRLAAPAIVSGIAARTVFAVIQWDGPNTTYDQGNVIGSSLDDPGNSAFLLAERDSNPASYPALNGGVGGGMLASGVSTPPTGTTVIAATYSGGVGTSVLFWQEGSGTLSSVSTSMTLDTGTTPYYIGSYHSWAATGLDGKIAEVAVWNRALSTAEMQHNADYYVSHYVIPEPGTIVILVTGMIALLPYALRKRK